MNSQGMTNGDLIATLRLLKWERVDVLGITWHNEKSDVIQVHEDFILLSLDGLNGVAFDTSKTLFCTLTSDPTKLTVEQTLKFLAGN